ncbi:MAG: endolytic transglycosylase MltG [bacterium]|nr:endolytic transglycosylase MltG [bacterium]
MHKRKRSPLRRGIFILCALVVIVLVVFGTLFIIPQGPASAGAASVTLDSDVDVVVAMLREQGVLRYATAFRVALALRGGQIQGGRYEISPHLSVWSLVHLVTTTQPRAERTLTIIEGWNLRDIGHYLEIEGIAQAEELHELVGFPAMDYRNAEPAIPRPTHNFDVEFPFLTERPEFVGFEGYLFPDTYRVFEDATVEDIVTKMLRHFDTQMTLVLREEIAASGRTLHQVVTMASIIEEEVADDAARPIVADILWKRRDQGWLLQADSTVNYVTGKSDARTLFADHAVDSSFNTYRYAGLPRGPISNPGMASILAAIRPEPSPYWFFLTAPDGTMHYARTLDEHNANIRKYLR